MTKKTVNQFPNCLTCKEDAIINRNIFDCGKLQCPTQKHVCGMMLTDEEVKAYKRSRGDI